MHERRWWAPIVHFATHALVGTAIFVIIAIPAVLLSFAVNFLKPWVSGFAIDVLTTLEYAILVIDALLLAAYLVIASWGALREWLK